MSDLEKYPYHTQTVERHVKIAADGTRSGCGKERREGYTGAKLESLKSMAKYTTKSDWKS